MTKWTAEFRREYQREYQRRLRTRERLGDVFYYRDAATGELIEEPNRDSKWDADSMREYKREWTRRRRRLEKWKFAIELLRDAARAILQPGFVAGFYWGVMVERARWKAQSERYEKWLERTK